MYRLAVLKENKQMVLLQGHHYYALERVWPNASALSMQSLMAQTHELHRAYAELSLPADGIWRVEDIDAPIVHGCKVMGIGLNYHAHAKEVGVPLPKTPMVFGKFFNSLSTATSDIALTSNQVDWEAELVVMMGKTAKHVSVARAWSCVAGVMLGQDISDRQLQLKDGAHAQWSLGKSVDGFGPVGPYLLGLECERDLLQGDIYTMVSDQRKQHGQLDDMIFSVPELISFLSQYMTLEPGDILFTGTPGGVGLKNNTFLKKGDRVITGSSLFTATLNNRCV